MDALTIVGLLFFALGAIAWFLFTFVFTNYKRLAVPVAAILTFLGALVLIFNAVIHPDSIEIPEVTPPVIETPEINVPGRNN